MILLSALYRRLKTYVTSKFAFFTLVRHHHILNKWNIAWFACSRTTHFMLEICEHVDIYCSIWWLSSQIPTKWGCFYVEYTSLDIESMFIIVNRWIKVAKEQAADFLVWIYVIFMLIQRLLTYQHEKDSYKVLNVSIE